MKLVRYGPAGAERPGILDAEGRIRALSPLLSDISVALLSPESLAILGAIDPERLPLVEGQPRLGVPVSNLRQIVAIGLNYRDHAAECDMAIPAYPMQFAKSIAALSGATDDVRIPADARKTDWEVELGFVIGTAARNVAVADALDHVAGYCLTIDFSEREWQFDKGGQFGKGKSLDGFAPVGPWLATRDEITDPQKLPMWLKVNGEIRQDSSTAEMIFPVAEIVAHLSRYQTLLPGDFIITGTPAGVGFGMKEPEYLKIGDEVTCGIEGLGEQRHRIALLG